TKRSPPKATKRASTKTRPSPTAKSSLHKVEKKAIPASVERRNRPGRAPSKRQSKKSPSLLELQGDLFALDSRKKAPEVAMAKGWQATKKSGKRPRKSKPDRKAMSGSAGLITLPVEALSESDAARELEHLADEIEHHDRHYYSKDSPEISDEQY